MFNVSNQTATISNVLAIDDDRFSILVKLDFVI